MANPPGVIALTSFDSEDVILEAVQAGADGFLAKDADPAELIEAVRSAARGEGALLPRAARTVMAHVHADSSAQMRREGRPRVDQLTDREQEIAAAVATGLTHAHIPQRPCRSEAT